MSESKDISRREFLAISALATAGTAAAVAGIENEIKKNRKAPESPPPPPGEPSPSEAARSTEVLSTENLEKLIIAAKRGDWRAALYLTQNSQQEYCSSANLINFGPSFYEMVNHLGDLEGRPTIRNHQLQAWKYESDDQEEWATLNLAPKDTPCYLDTLSITPDRIDLEGNRAKMVLDPNLIIVIQDGEGNTLIEKRATEFFKRTNWPKESQDLVTEPMDPGAIGKLEIPIVSQNGLNLVLKKKKATLEEPLEDQDVPWYARVKVDRDTVRLSGKPPAPLAPTRKWWYSCRVVRLNRHLPPPPEEGTKNEQQFQFRNKKVIEITEKGVINNLTLRCAQEDLPNYQIKLTYPSGENIALPASLFLGGLPAEYLAKHPRVEYNHFILTSDANQVIIRLKLPLFCKPGTRFEIEKQKPSDSEATLSYQWRNGLTEQEEGQQLKVETVQTGNAQERPGLTKLWSLRGEVIVCAANVEIGNIIQVGFPGLQEYWELSTDEGTAFWSDGSSKEGAPGLEDFTGGGYYNLNPVIGLYGQQISGRGGYLLFDLGNLNPDHNQGVEDSANTKGLRINSGHAPFPLRKKSGLIFFRERGPRAYFTTTAPALSTIWYYQRPSHEEHSLELSILSEEKLAKRYSQLTKAVGAKESLAKIDFSLLPDSVRAFLDWYSIQACHFLEGPEREITARELDELLKIINTFSRRFRAIEDESARALAWQKNLVTTEIKHESLQIKLGHQLIPQISMDLVGPTSDLSTEQFKSLMWQYLGLEEEAPNSLFPKLWDLTQHLIYWRVNNLSWRYEYDQQVAILRDIFQYAIPKVFSLEEISLLKKRYAEDEQAMKIFDGLSQYYKKAKPDSETDDKERNDQFTPAYREQEIRKNG
ncbi:hypothetical protein ACFLZP_00500 [Patescibacteria group bacterium]